MNRLTNERRAVKYIWWCINQITKEKLGNKPSTLGNNKLLFKAMIHQAGTVTSLSQGLSQRSQFANTTVSLEEQNLLNLIAEIVVHKTLSISHEESIAVPTLQQRRSEPT
jgi:hypothetical protein